MKEFFHRLYDDYNVDLFTFMFYMIRNREQAESLVQQVYFNILQSYVEFIEKTNEKTGLFSEAYHVTLEWLAKQKSEISNDKPVQNTSLNPNEIIVQNDEIQTLYKCMEKCSLEERTVLILLFVNSFSINEASKILGWSEHKVNKKLHSGKKIIKKHMQLEAYKAIN